MRLHKATFANLREQRGKLEGCGFDFHKFLRDLSNIAAKSFFSLSDGSPEVADTSRSLGHCRGVSGKFMKSNSLCETKTWKAMNKLMSRGSNELEVLSAPTITFSQFSVSTSSRVGFSLRSKIDFKPADELASSPDSSWKWRRSAGSGNFSWKLPRFNPGKDSALFSWAHVCCLSLDVIHN